MTDKSKILLVEDERMLAEILCDTLNGRHFNVTVAYDGLQALELAHKDQYDAIVTDIMMPNMDGYTFVKQIRKEGNSTPVLFLTARSATEDVVTGFETGGNDYLKKPFAIDELIVRIKALIGKEKNTGGNSSKKAYTDTTYTIGIYKFNHRLSTLTVNGETKKLAARESAVLYELCRNMGETVDTSQLLKKLWGDDNYFNLRSLNVYITRLRHHLEEDNSIEITSIRGTGYKLDIL